MMDEPMKELWASDRSHLPADERPTAVRYQVLTFLGVLAFVFYLDRICIAKAGPQIQEDLGITATKMGFVYAAFTVAYVLFEVPTGSWGDRYGSRGVLTRIVCSPAIIVFVQ